jgi:hypothetical protein
MRSAKAASRRFEPCPLPRISLVRLSPHLIRRLVLAEADVNGVTQETIDRPGQIGDLGDKLWLDLVHS